MLQGDTGNLPLSNLFQTLALNQQEGVLSVSYGRSERWLAIRGNAVSIISEKPHVSRVLPRVLAKLKILTEVEYQNVSATLAKTSAPGDILIDRHLVTRDQICGPVRELVCEAMYETFLWVGAKYRFEVKPVPREHQLFTDSGLDGALSIPVNSLLMEVARREDEWTRIRTEIVAPHEFFRITATADQLAQFQSPDGLDPTRLQQLFALFDGQISLEEALVESPIPEFYVYSHLRALKERKMVMPITIDEKRKLAESLRNKFQLDRVASVYRSILAECPDDVEVRKKLVLFLERKKQTPEELAHHYELLASSAGKRSDDNEQRQYLEKLVEVKSDHLPALGELARLAADGKREKDWTKYFGAYVDRVNHQELFAEGADMLEVLLAHRPEDGRLLTEAANLQLRAGDHAKAKELYVRAASHFHKRRDEINLKKIVSVLERIDASACNRWRRALSDLNGPRRELRLLGIGAGGWLVLLVLFGVLGAAGTYEWKARVAHAEAFDRAQTMVRDGSLERAHAELDGFGDRFRFSLVALQLGNSHSVIDVLYQEKTDREAAGTNKGPSAMTDSLEKILSMAARHQQDGDLAQALKLYDSVDLENVPPAAASHLQRERTKIRRYLEEASGLAKDAQVAVREGRFEEAYAFSQQIAIDYRSSPEFHSLKIPILLTVLPPYATIMLGSERHEGSPLVVQVRPGQEATLDISAPGFVSAHERLDPLGGATRLIELARIPFAHIDWPRSIEASPAVHENRLYVGTRSGSLLCWDLDRNQRAWEFRLEYSSDVLGGVRTFRGDAVFAGADGAVYRVDSTGKLVYRVDIPPEVGYSRKPLTPPLANGWTFVSTNKGVVVCVDVARGRERWRHPVDTGQLSAPIVAGELVYVATLELGKIQALGIQSGEPAWVKDVPALSSEMAVTDRYLVFGTKESKIVALDLMTGNLAWEQTIAGLARGEILARADGLYFTTENGRVERRKVDGGELDWSSEHITGFDRGPVGSGDEVYVVDRDGRICALSANSGAPVWVYKSEGAPGAGLGHSEHYVIKVGETNGIHVVPVGPPGDAGVQK